MVKFEDPNHAVVALRRALSGSLHSQLRQASVEVDVANRVVRVRFEYDGEPESDALEACQIAGTELISDYPSPWNIDEQHRPADTSRPLSPLAHVAYNRDGV
jgi:hypothetical protein